MRWIIRAGEVGLMAAITVCRECRVVVVGVARGTGNGGVRAGKRERSVVVIEGRRGPAAGGVTDRAVSREAGRDVIWVGGSGEVFLVAAVTTCRQSCVVIVYVARGTSHCGVCAGERKRRVAVIESGRRPCRGVVTRDAGGGKTYRYVIGIVGSRPICLVAAVAVCGQSCVVVVGVACGASDCGVSARERE